MSLYSLDDMTDETFDQLVLSSKEAHEAQLAAKAKAESERAAKEQAAAAEQERIRQENVKLREEAAAREAEIEAERGKREQIEKAEAARQAEEAAKVREAAETARKALHASDREKLIKFADDIDSIVPPIVSAASTAFILQEAINSLHAVAIRVRTEAEEL